LAGADGFGEVVADAGEDFGGGAVGVGGEIVFERFGAEAGAVVRGAGRTGWRGRAVGWGVAGVRGEAVVGAAGYAGFEQDGLANAAGDFREEFAEGGVAEVERAGHVRQWGHAGHGWRAAFGARLQVAQGFALGGFGEGHAEFGQALAHAEVAGAALGLVVGDGVDGVQGRPWVVAVWERSRTMDGGGWASFS
jgi:hypothetical protein